MEAVLQLEGLTASWSQLDRVLLPARVPGYRSADLDMLAATGRVVWVGLGSLGFRDGRVALYRRERISELYGRDAVEAQTEGIHRVLTEHLHQRGACFLMELAQAAEAAGCIVAKEHFEAAIWDLVWTGQVTNDTFEPLRNLAGGTRSRRRGRESSLAGGHWSLVSDLVGETSDTERLLARSQMLLERYGLVSREVVQSEAIPGGFGPIYRVLKQMEEGGQVRRGWFVEGLSGAQFALAGAVDRMRSARMDEVPVDGWSETDIRVLAAADPANPCGSLLPWPDAAGGKALKRSAGVWIILVAGKPVLYLSAGGKGLTSIPCSFSEEGGELPLALSALQQIPRTGRRRMLIQTIDGESALPASAHRG